MTHIHILDTILNHLSRYRRSTYTVHYHTLKFSLIALSDSSQTAVPRCQRYESDQHGSRYTLTVTTQEPLASNGRRSGPLAIPLTEHIRTRRWRYFPHSAHKSHQHAPRARKKVKGPPPRDRL